MDRPPLDADRLRDLAGARWPRIEVVTETVSTNADLLARPAALDRSVLVAEHQTGGRGRLDRAWMSPPGAGLTFSVLLRPAAPPSAWGWLPLRAGVAVAEAVRGAGVDVRLKWPNDVLAGPGERKVAGILAQSAGPVVVIGIGLNVTTRAEELPLDSATSLSLEGAADVDRTALLAAVLNQLDTWLERDDPAAYRSRCATVGRQVRVALADGTALAGRATDVDESGRLLVAAPGGYRAIVAGDVVHVRGA